MGGPWTVEKICARGGSSSGSRPRRRNDIFYCFTIHSLNLVHLHFPVPRPRADRHFVDACCCRHIAGAQLGPGRKLSVTPIRRSPPVIMETSGPSNARLNPTNWPWLRNEKCVLVTDREMRGAHQSLLATRMRTRPRHDRGSYVSGRGDDLRSWDSQVGSNRIQR